MVQAGLASEVILEKIKISRCNFETEPHVLIELKHRGVPDAVLSAMIKAPYGMPLKPPADKPIPPPASADQPSTSSAVEENAVGREAVKALRKLVSATDVGVSYVNYGPLVAEVKTDVDDAILRMSDGDLKNAVASSMRQYEMAAEVWRLYWRSDFIDGEYKDIATKQYGVKKQGLFRVVWRSEFLAAIWGEARNQFEIAQRLLPQRVVNGQTHVLAGAWTITLEAQNQTFEFALTVDANGMGTIRSPMGSGPANIGCRERHCTIFASDTYKKQTMGIRLDGTLDSDGVLTGSATITRGKESVTTTFKGMKLGRASTQ